MAAAHPGFETWCGQKQPFGSPMPISDLRTPLGIVFDGGDDGNIVSVPFVLLLPHFWPQSWPYYTHQGGITPTWCAAHTYIGKTGGAYLASAFFSSPVMLVCVCVAPRGTCVVIESVDRELLLKCPEALREDLLRQPRLLGILPLGRQEGLQDPQDLPSLLCGARRAYPASEPRLRAWEP